MKTLAVLAVVVVALAAVSPTKAATAAECQALVNATLTGPYRGCEPYSLTLEGDLRLDLCKHTCKPKFKEMYDFCKAAKADPGNGCKTAYDAKEFTAGKKDIQDFCDTIIAKYETSGYCNKVDTIVSECKTQFDEAYGNKTECHGGNYTAVTREKTCNADLNNSFSCSEGLYKLFHQDANLTKAPRACSGDEIESRLLPTMFNNNSDTASNEVGVNWAYRICTDANHEACDDQGPVQNAYSSIRGQRCPTAEDIERSRVSACGDAYFDQPGAQELKPGSSWSDPKNPGTMLKSACKGNTVHDMVCAYFDVNKTNTKCEKAKTDLYSWCIDNSGGCAYNDTRNKDASYAKNYCRHIVEIKEGTMKCNAPPTPATPPTPNPSPPPPPSTKTKEVVTKMTIIVTGKVDEAKLQANAIGSVMGTTATKAKVTVTYGATIAAILQVVPKEADVRKNMAAAFKVPEAQILDVVIRETSSSGRRRLLQTQAELLKTAKATLQVTVATPDYDSAKSLTGSAKATAASAISKIDPAVYVGESETTASIEYEFTVPENVDAKTMTVSTGGLTEGVTGLRDDIRAIISQPSSVEKSSLPTKPDSPPKYVVPATTAADSGASRVAATAVAVFAAVIALFFLHA